MTCATPAEVDWAMARGAVLAPISMMADRAPTTADSVLSWSLLRRVLLCGRRFLLQARCVPSRSHHIEMTEISQRVGPLRVRLGHSATSAQCPVCRKADTAKRFTSTRPNKRDRSSLKVGRRRALGRSISINLKKEGPGGGVDSRHVPQGRVRAASRDLVCVE